MFNFFRGNLKKGKPEFNSLQAFSKKDKYFYRVATWDWLNEKEIYICDPHGPRMITLDDWPQIVFLDAKGKLTVAEYVDYMASLYRSKIPKELDETIIYQLNSLEELKLIEYSDNEINLAPKFESPISQHNKDE